MSSPEILKIDQNDVSYTVILLKYDRYVNNDALMLAKVSFCAEMGGRERSRGDRKKAHHHHIAQNQRCFEKPCSSETPRTPSQFFPRFCKTAPKIKPPCSSSSCHVPLSLRSLLVDGPCPIEGPYTKAVVPLKRVRRWCWFTIAKWLQLLCCCQVYFVLGNFF